MAAVKPVLSIENESPSYFHRLLLYRFDIFSVVHP